MKTTEGLTPKITNHFIKTIQSKGFDPQKIIDAFKNPERVYPSGSHPGQYRVTGNGLCIVGKPEGNRFVMITCYLDGVLTPPREDQLKSAEGYRYAKRYQQGLGRG